jgi:AraC family transcriptional regulator
LAKIADAVQQALAARRAAGAAGGTIGRTLASGEGWTVSDVICSAGPDDRRFEERHATFAIAVVLAGTFQYRAAPGRELLTPGSLMLGTAGWCFECGHDHGAGDRCVSFSYATPQFERLAFDAGIRGRADFASVRLPPLRALAPFVARTAAGALGASDVAWAELSVELAARTLQIAKGLPTRGGAAPRGAVARVSRTVRVIERHPEAPFTLAALARDARLSPYHFLRTFQQVAGTTPHQYLLRARLRAAAARVAAGDQSILDAALDAGFGDVSNFNRMFRAEFGASPRRFRQRMTNSKL